MDPLLLILLLIVAAVILLVGDLFLPSAGIMSLIGLALLLTAVIVCFTINRWLGLGVLFACVVGSPFIGMAMIRAWQKTPIGRKMVLSHTEAAPPRQVVRVGQIGRALSAMRPMGECAFSTDLGEVTIQAKSEFGDLPPGVPVRVTHFKDGVATVRRLETPPPVPGVAPA